MHVITMLNQKGGVGKTSTCYHVGGMLAQMGLRVLLVDNDPQASLTQGFFGSSATAAMPERASIAAAYDVASSPVASELIRATGWERLAIIPGSPALTASNMLPMDQWFGRHTGIRDLLETVDDFDLAIIDCPPNLHLVSYAALIASQSIVVPLQAEDFGAQGLRPVQSAIAEVQRAGNASLRLAGYLITMFDRRLGIHAAYDAKLREMYPGLVFDAPLPLAKDFKESVADRRPISSYRPKCAAAKATKIVAQELLERCGLANLQAGRAA